MVFWYIGYAFMVIHMSARILRLAGSDSQKDDFQIPDDSDSLASGLRN